jgi:predicted RND superfamily exporter protein
MRLGWSHVMLVTVLVAGVVILAVFGKDTAPLIALASAVLLGAGITVGIHQQGEIKATTNGNSSQLIALLETMTRQLALMTPPPPVPGPVGEPVGSVDSGVEQR